MPSNSAHKISHFSCQVLVISSNAIRESCPISGAFVRSKVGHWETLRWEDFGSNHNFRRQRRWMHTHTHIDIYIYILLYNMHIDTRIHKRYCWNMLKLQCRLRRNAAMYYATLRRYDATTRTGGFAFAHWSSTCLGPSSPGQGTVVISPEPWLPCATCAGCLTCKTCKM